MKLIFLDFVSLVFWANALAATDITSWEDFKSLVQDNNILTVDELLDHLPEAYTKGHALIYRPMALDRHLVSMRRPRVLLFGKTGQFMLTYNSHPSGGVASPGDREFIETLELKGDRAYLREIELNGSDDPFLNPVEVNPKRCTQCHGSDPRGLWDPYNMWPGVYGSISRGSLDFIRFGTPEYLGYMDYLNEKEINPRYRFLQQSSKTFSEWSQAPERLLRPRDPSTMADALIISDGYTTMPNQFIGMFLGEHNFARLGRVMSELPEAKRRKYQYLIKGLELDEQYSESPRDKTFDCFRKIDEFLPDSPDFDHLKLPTFLDRINLAMASDYSRQKSLVERDNLGLSLTSPGFDSSDPFDLDISGRNLVYDPTPLVLMFNRVDPQFNGSKVLAYALQALDMDEYESNIAINSARYSFYYGNRVSCKRPKEGYPVETLCFDEMVEKFFSSYLNEFYLDPEIEDLSCDQLATLSRRALAR